ncbi:polyphosphate kinase 1 [Companilactobacillus alimentarius]|uniref:Polyphosphate kinase n=1 Tax=Companilactobacillus alimentarius DSM 20249 TaxID=1423720 RepID=A0A2K9HI79_9LACO|nr:polyphosphate kinase 1 [Companilactobacillus alimentarius]AUI72261.1 polyphosphate kinase 1 [Companilactobacillus alimentarius DSM 20249]KRK77516.1 polyphosphate kinase 1 [Companilactobacillus alimentarius DSM 20249]GEO45485.1 polyphosphate kinase [Companilactobacillus alimentarius]
MKRKYYNRDLSWILFDNRVIDQAYNSDVPLLERLRFLSIASNNLDEFFRVRMHNIDSMVTNNKTEKRTDLTGDEVLDLVYEFNARNIAKQYKKYDSSMKDARKRDLFYILKYKELSDSEKKYVKKFYSKKILPRLDMQRFSKVYKYRHNLNFLMETPHHIYTCPVPEDLGRLIETGVDNHYILIEDLIKNVSTELMRKYKVSKTYVFRVTYDQNKPYDFLDKNMSDEEYLNKMINYVDTRELRKIMRVEFAGDEEKRGRNYFTKLFDISKKSVYKIPGPVDIRFLNTLFKRYKNHSDLVFAPFKALKWNPSKNILQYLNNSPILVQYPYDSFSVFINYLEMAVNDPKTTKIFITIYRTEKNSDLLRLLKEAASKGIKVTAIVELRARFDEVHNIQVAKVLKDAGVRVLLGDKVNKVHSKICLVLHGDNRGYVQIGTGNYNAITANAFSDLSYFTSNQIYVDDATKFFDHLVNGTKEDYNLLVTSPDGIKDMIISNIKEATAAYLRDGQGSVFMKVNGLTDVDIISAIYTAAKQGLPFRMIVRGPCSLKIGICGSKEDIRVKSIVGELLEHSRIFKFQYGNDHTDVWISSADMMTRNLERRVEIAVPIVEDKAKLKLTKIIKVFLKDTENSYWLDSDGDYDKEEEENGISAQQTWLSRLKWRKYIETN